MKIDTHNSLGHRFSSISDINRLIAIDYYRLQSILSIIEFHQLDTSGLLLWSDLTKFVCHATASGQVTG